MTSCNAQCTKILRFRSDDEIATPLKDSASSTMKKSTELEKQNPLLVLESRFHYVCSNKSFTDRSKIASVIRCFGFSSDVFIFWIICRQFLCILCLLNKYNFEDFFDFLNETFSQFLCIIAPSVFNDSITKLQHSLVGSSWFMLQ